MVDTTRLERVARNERGGSSPSSGTKRDEVLIVTQGIWSARIVSATLTISTIFEIVRLV
jgi:hypothetical protein